MKNRLVMIPLFISLFLSFNIQASECRIDWDKGYFQDLGGETEYNAKTKKVETIYEKFTKFQGNFPKLVSLNFPFKGDCSNFKVTEVSVYRKIGKRALPGGENDHSKHALGAKDLKYESTPFEIVSPEVMALKKVLVIKKFQIFQALESLPADQHPWEMRYEISYKDEQGVDTKRTHMVSLPLIH